MDNKDMQVDPDPETDTISTGFIFSRPNIIPSPEKHVNFGAFTDSANVFGGRTTQFPEASSFTFAKPATIERQDYGDESHTTNQNVQANRIFQPSALSTQDIKKTKDESHATNKNAHNKKKVQPSPFSVQDIKKTTAFTQLEKNSKKNENIKLEVSKSISCLDVPDSLLVKSVAKEYFEQFGEILKITIRPKRKIITVYYGTKVEASEAYNNTGSFLGHDFKVEWTNSDLLLKPKKKESIKGKISSILNIDDDVKEELEALKGLEYNLPDTQNLKVLTAVAKAKVRKAKVVANKEAKPLMKAAKALTTRSSSIKRPLTSLPLASKIAIASEKSTPIVEAAGNQVLKISSTTIEELKSQVRQAGTTSEEKWKILDARDRLMRLKRNKQKKLATAKVTVGVCPDMCPEKERYMREFQRQLSPYEQMEGGEYRINHSVAVKQYSRSSADQEEPMAHDLRPVKSLKMTMSYLLHEIADLCEEDDANLTEWYHFLWDRMRSIRKDITQQELCCVDTVELVEQCARFHILSSERLCAEEASVFDPKINSENLTKCLQSLKYMYYDLRENGISCKNEPEFRAYIILLNLNNGTFISELRTLPPEVQHSTEVKFALEVHSAIAMDNYCRFFKLVRNTSYLNACILLRYFNQVRVKALSIMVKAYCRTSGTTEYPLYELIDILGFEDEDEVFDFCSRVGLKVDKESLYIKLNKEQFRRPDSMLEQNRAYNLVLSKRVSVNQAVGECIAGGVWPEKTYENHKPHSSFDSQGYLLPSSINAQDQNSADPYEFMDEEENDVQFVSEQKGTKVVNKISNNIDEKKQSNAVSKSTNAEFSFKQPEPIFSAPTTNKIFSVTTAASTPSSSVNDPKFFTPTATTTATTSIFAKPPASIFQAIPTKPSVLPTNSPFSMTMNKSIFAGTTNQTNLFKLPSVSAMSVPMKQDTVDAASDRVSTKRRLEQDSESSVEKKKLLEKDELRRKQLETEERLRIEREKLHRLEQLNKCTSEQYEQLQKEVLEEMCSSIVQVELDRIKLIGTLSNEIFDSLVREICESILDEQLFIQDMLIEVERRLRDRLVIKYYRMWKQWAAKRRAQRREALDNTPVWLQPQSLEERARQLYHPEQKVAIKYARENKRKSLVADEEKKQKLTPIEFIINVGLKENAKSLDVEPSQNAFWKMVISWPLLENRLTLWRHKKVVNKYLSPEDYTIEPIIIQHKPNPLEHLDICIRHFEGLICDNYLTGMDALLFIVSADEQPRSIERRLTKSVLSREKLMPIPLVILIFGDEDRDPKVVEIAPIVENLLESGYVSEYTVLYERSVDENVVLSVLQSATMWLAINKSPSVPLEMDYLKRVFDDCLTEELWLRIQGHLSNNPKFSKPLNDPNFIINLHNEAVNHIMDIILDPESMTYTDFAPELKVYLNSKRTYPCTYEYFDIVWKHPEYRAELERIMSSFIFPPWKESWPIHDTMELHEAITDYCCQILPYECSVSVTNNIMSDMFLISGHSEDNCQTFTDVILHIIGKKLTDIGGNTRVVYNKNHIKHFQTLPWWFKSSILMDYMIQQEENDKEEEENQERNLSTSETAVSQMQNSIPSTSQMDINFECDIDELDQTCRQQDEELGSLDEFCQETCKRFADVQACAETLEKQLKEQRLKNEALEARLKEALKDEIFDSCS
ncbi:hypothetical protein TSAR_015026 [Trichomalopsis sarcophagae]|uniref:SAC3/GANP/THP3 conserved domain-containing protein n=1 Tax=Trichomalopsis sarcophagae TaxID=543379 RepID=A0A232FFA3_9HYME|nr:hypothetical protein TSAR_015026 [Trichomalopsis sarcophagae]